MKLHSKIRQSYALLLIATIVVLSGCVVDEDPTGMLNSEEEITVDGGSISIIDEHNNTIEVIFPKDALDKATQIYLGILAEQPELPIETQHVSAFEIKPYDAELYNPITVKVAYNEVIQEIEQNCTVQRKNRYVSSPGGSKSWYRQQEYRSRDIFIGCICGGKNVIGAD